MITVLTYNYRGDLVRNYFKDATHADYEKENDNDLILRDNTNRIIASFSQDIIEKIIK